MGKVIEFPSVERVGLSEAQQHFADIVTQVTAPIKMAIGHVANVGYGKYVAESRYAITKASTPFISADSARFHIFHGYDDREVRGRRLNSRPKQDYKIFTAECFDGRQKTFKAFLINRQATEHESDMWGNSHGADFLPEGAQWSESPGRHFVPETFFTLSLDTIVEAIRASQAR